MFDVGYGFATLPRTRPCRADSWDGLR